MEDKKAILLHQNFCPSYFDTKTIEKEYYQWQKNILPTQIRLPFTNHFKSEVNYLHKYLKKSWTDLGSPNLNDTRNLNFLLNHHDDKEFRFFHCYSYGAKSIESSLQDISDWGAREFFWLHCHYDNDVIKKHKQYFEKISSEYHLICKDIVSLEQISYEKLIIEHFKEFSSALSDEKQYILISNKALSSKKLLYFNQELDQKFCHIHFDLLPGFLSKKIPDLNIRDKDLALLFCDSPMDTVLNLELCISLIYPQLQQMGANKIMCLPSISKNQNFINLILKICKNQFHRSHLKVVN